MAKKRVIVIGAGISGLTLAIKLLQNDFDVTIYEKNDNVGGLCSGFFVDGFYIDACLHWLTGTQGQPGIHDFWVNNDMLNDDVKIISLPSLGSFEYKGTKVTFWRDVEKTYKEWMEIAPEDAKEIKKFFAMINLVDYTLDSISKLGASSNFKTAIKTIFKLIPNSGLIYRTLRCSRERYAKRFKNEAIRFALKNVQNGYNNMFFFLYEYTIFKNGNADLPEGGAYYMMERAKNRFLSLGGKLYLDSPINEVVVKDGVACGVYQDNNFVEADIVISTADPYFTTNILLKGEHEDHKYNRMKRREFKHKIVSIFNVYFAIDSDLTDIPIPLGINVEPFKCGAHDVDVLMFRPYYYDPEYFIKDGKTIASVNIDQDKKDFEYWFELYEKSIEVYQREVKNVIDHIMGELVKRFPAFEGKIKVLTSFGPVEIKHRNNNIYGAIQPFAFGPGSSFFVHNFRVKKLKNFYMASQWSKSIGGTPMAALNANSCAREILKDFNKNGD